MATHRPPLTIPEAAQALAVSDKTIRRMLKEGILTEQARDAGNRILIAAQSIEAAAAQLGRARPRWPDEPSHSAPLAQPDQLQQLAAMFSDLMREKDQRIYELQGELAEARAAQKYLPDLAEAERARARELDQALADAQAEIARLQAAGQTTGRVSIQDAQGSLMGRIRRLLGRWVD